MRMNRHLAYPDIPYHKLLHRSAQRWPDRIAIVFGDQRISFAEFDDLVTRFAVALRAQGLRPGDRVALYLANCPEYEIAFWGCARAGAIPTPLNPSYKEREAKHQIADAGAVALVVESALQGVVQAIQRDLPDLHHVIVVGEAERSFGIPFNSMLGPTDNFDSSGEQTIDDVAALPYSSGTTGSTKGVMLTQRNLVCNALQFVDATETTERDSILIFLPLSHIYGVALMNCAIVGGATQVLLTRFDLEMVLKLLVQERVTQLYIVPPVMLALAHAAGLTASQFSGLRFVMSAAAPLAAEVGIRVSERLQVPVQQAYGMTEASPLTHMVPHEQWRVRAGSVGVAVADTQCRITDLDNPQSEVDHGIDGEVTIRGPQVMSGYWHSDGDNELALRNRWLYTGDVGHVDAEGNLYIVDRKKEMIKYKAFSIAPAELEAVLLEHPSVRDCAVTGQPDEEAGEVPHAYVVMNEDDSTTPEELQIWVAERVATYKQIRTIEVVATIPRTPSGKILRRVLKERERNALL